MFQKQTHRLREEPMVVSGEGWEKEIGSLARKDIEEFIGSKVYLELFVKVKPKWRDNDMKLKEFGY